MAKITLKKEIEINTNGDLPSVGEQAKDFTLINKALEEVQLKDFKEDYLVLNIYPSIDTPVCAKSAREFNEALNEKSNVKVLNISYDLPFALGRFCAAEGLDNVETLSCFRTTFSKDYGTDMIDGPLKGLSARAVLVLDKDRKVTHSQLVSEIVDEPDYQSAINAVNS